MTALRVSIVNGDLSFIAQPVLVGHYRGVTLTGTEYVLDRLIGRRMQAALDMGRYPDLVGSHQVFVNREANRNQPLQLPRPEAVVVVGLGDEGALRGVDLVRTVRQGALAWADRRAEELQPASSQLEIAATLIGSGGSGISSGQAAHLVLEGVLAANAALRDAKRPPIAALHLIELYLDRATEAWRSLHYRAGVASASFELAPYIQTGVRALQRPVDASYRGANYDMIMATSCGGKSGRDAISYTVDTKRARTEVHAQAAQRRLLTQLVASASSERPGDSRIGRTLFRLLVPAELEPFLSSTTDALLVVDAGTAGIPWEMLDAVESGEDDHEPWAIRSKLVRKLQTASGRPALYDVPGDAHVLIIGEPACDDDDTYPRLHGAQQEALEVSTLLQDKLPGVNVRALLSDKADEKGPRAATIVNTMFERDWRVVHITGHGAPPLSPDDPRGVVLSDDAFLGPREFRNLRRVPELVFLNCCYLATRDPNGLLKSLAPYDRPKFAAGIAETLIDLGVRCVVAAGWAVEQDAAKAFATTFYGQLLRNARFMDAVAEARRSARKLGGNTWAAFQCYGDPDWTLRASYAPESAVSAMDVGKVPSATALVLVLQTMASEPRYADSVGSERLRGELEALEREHQEQFGTAGAVAEAFADAWVRVDRGQALRWYERALAANDGRGSLRAAEQLGNLRVRVAWETLDRQINASRGAPKSELFETARQEMQRALRLLEVLADQVQSTSERESLCGSAWKRLALLESLAERSEEELLAIESMKNRYARAESLAQQSGDPGLFYPALNRIAAELVVDAARPGWPGLDQASIDRIRAALEAKVNTDPDFWSVADVTNLRVYQAVARRKLASELATLEQEYMRLYDRVSLSWMWASIRDTLRFVLTKYAPRVDELERSACDELMTLVASYAERVS